MDCQKNQQHLYHSTGRYVHILLSVYMFLQSVAQKSERIADEEAKCQHMADLAQSDLNEALPALEEAIKVSVEM